MVKHTQTIRRKKPKNCLSVFDQLLALALKGLNLVSIKKSFILKQTCGFFYSIDFSSQ